MKKSDERKESPFENKADAEFVINIRINYLALGRLPPHKLPFKEKNYDIS
jgi:hypothetical protein